MTPQECYCINPHCPQTAHPNNNDPNTRYCQSCGSDLLLNGKYRVSRLLSDDSGFGLVYEVFEGFKTKILKVLLQRWNSEPKVIELFKREYDVLLALNSQGITGVPQVEDYFIYTTKKGISLYCLVMEKVEGINLEQWVKQYDKLNQKQALKWLREITLILDKIHQQNWFHRDIKPPNIMRRNSGELVLIDFGTAREETQTYYQRVQGQQLTRISSAGYTPNEQQHGQAVIQSDFFALGRTFVHLLTGKSPLDLYDAVNDVLTWREETENIHPLLLDLIEELMGRLPKDRPANTRVILQRLDEIERQLNKPLIKNQKLRNGFISISGVLLLLLTGYTTYNFWRYGFSAINPMLLFLSSNSFLDKTLIGHKERVTSLDYSPDGQHLASGSWDDSVKIWDTPTGKIQRGITGNSSPIVYSLDGHYLSSTNFKSDRGKSIRILDVENGKELHTLKGHDGQFWSVDFSPDGGYLASGSSDKTIKIWNLKTWEEVRTLTGHQSSIFAIAYSPGGKYLASGSYDKTIKIWEVETGKELQTLKGHQDSVWSVAYSPDGKYLASGSYDKTIKIWEVATGKELYTLKGHQDSVWSVAYSPDGRYLASGSGDNTIKIWDAETGQELRTLTGHSNSVRSVVYSPDGRYLASGSYDTTIKIWRVGP